MSELAHRRADAAPRLRVGVLGAAGQLGRSLVRSIEKAEDIDLAFAITRNELDLAEVARVGPFIDSLGTALPDVVVNAAAYTKVDHCESEEELAYQMNAAAPAEWARQLSDRDLQFIHVSTDYVFPGDGNRPYLEDDVTDPKTVYGASKRAGEIAVLESHALSLVVRTSWVFGPGRNFVIAILDQAARRRSGELDGPLTVVDDQHGAPTSSADLADALLAIAGLNASGNRAERASLTGLLHLRNAEETTWFGFAKAILDEAGYSDLTIDPVSSSAFKTAAPRPAYSVLDCTRASAAGVSLRPWREALHDYLASPDCPSSLLGNASPDDSGSSDDQRSDAARSGGSQ